MGGLSFALSDASKINFGPKAPTETQIGAQRSGSDLEVKKKPDRCMGNHFAISHHPRAFSEPERVTRLELASAPRQNFVLPGTPHLGI